MTDHGRLAANLEELLDQLRGRVDHRALEQIADEGLSFSQARVMHLLNECGEPVPIHLVAERLDLSVASAGRNIDQLVQRGFVRRAESPDDRRVRLVSVTDAGRSGLTGQQDIWRQALRELVADLPGPIAANLDAALSRALDHYRTHPRSTPKETA